MLIMAKQKIITLLEERYKNLIMMQKSSHVNQKPGNAPGIAVSGNQLYGRQRLKRKKKSNI